jgi:hypothetical protein
MEIIFNVRGNRKQLECAKAWINDDISEILYGGGKAGGKSWLGVSLIFGDAFMYPDTRYFIARKTLADLVKFTSGTIGKVFADWKINESMYKFDGKNNVWNLHNGSKVFFLDAKWIPSDPTYARFGSMEMTRGWIEEAGEFEDERCVTSLANSLGRWRNKETGLKPKLLQTCNPAKNYLYEEYYLKKKDGELPPHRAFIQALVGDNIALGQEVIDDMTRRMAKDTSALQRLVYGNWEYDDNELSIFDYEKIIGLFTNEYVPKTGNKYLTADIAYEGSDIFAIGIWDGFVLEKVIDIEKISEVLVSQKIHQLRLEYGIPISNVIYDADGLRTFVKSSVKNGHLKGAKAFNNNSKALSSENYINLKTQCYFKLAEMTKKGDIFIQDLKHKKQIVQELEQICRQPDNNDGKIRLEKKSDLKKRLLRSPDFADMMMMRMLTEVNSSQPQKIIW